MRERKDFCTECRRETSYTLKKIKINQIIREKEYTFEITAAFCNECGGEMGIPGLMDYNMKEIDEQYRKAEEIITVEDINRLMKLYNIGKAPLSLALGFGEVTITRYLAGQVPSKEYSDIMLHALASASYMKRDRLQKGLYGCNATGKPLCGCPGGAAGGDRLYLLGAA